MLTLSGFQSSHFGAAWAGAVVVIGVAQGWVLTGSPRSPGSPGSP